MKPPLPEKDRHSFRCALCLKELPFNSDVAYRVELSGNVVREATFKTRATEDKSVRCVLVGSLAQVSAKSFLPLLTVNPSQLLIGIETEQFLNLAFKRLRERQGSVHRGNESLDLNGAYR